MAALRFSRANLPYSALKGGILQKSHSSFLSFYFKLRGLYEIAVLEKIVRKALDVFAVRLADKLSTRYTLVFMHYPSTMHENHPQSRLMAP